LNCESWVEIVKEDFRYFREAQAAITADVPRHVKLVYLSSLTKLALKKLHK